MKVTIKDVAKEANVAVSTVSRVLSNSGKISEKTKEKVWAAVKKLNYVPNDMARSYYWRRGKWEIDINEVDIQSVACRKLYRSRWGKKKHCSHFIMRQGNRIQPSTTLLAPPTGTMMAVIILLTRMTTMTITTGSRNLS